jgi:hypothetical protein
MDPNDALFMAQLGELIQRTQPPAEPLDIAEIYHLKAPPPEPEPPTEEELEAAARAYANDEAEVLGMLRGKKVEAALAHLAALGTVMRTFLQRRGAWWDMGVRSIDPQTVNDALAAIAADPGAAWLAEQVRNLAETSTARAAQASAQERADIVRRYWDGQCYTHGLGRNSAIAAVDPDTLIAHRAGSIEWERLTATPHAEALETVARYARHLATCPQCGGGS